MITLPDRLSSMITKLEAEQPISRKDLEKAVLLQALDLAKLGEDFARDTIANENKHTAILGDIP